MSKNILVAVAWPYANSLIHVGNITGSYLPADIYARYHRLAGDQVLMVSGSDAHGTPVTVRADAFCHIMVRALMGCLVAVGEGRRPDGWAGEVLAGRERDPAVTVMPAHGLTLEEVGYPVDADLATRAHLTRRVRSLEGER